MKLAVESAAAAPLSPEQARAYLDRIGLEHVPVRPVCTLELLDELVFAHQCSVPFESVDFAGGGPAPSLVQEDLFHKIVADKHGGFCIELTMLFEKLLLSLGYEARACLSRSVRGPEGADAINHRAELVKVGTMWHFADVGFGGPICARAIPVEDGARLFDGSYTFMCCQQDETWWSIERYTGGSSDIFGDTYESCRQVELLFCTAAVEDRDFELLCEGLSKPGSYFYEHALVNLRTPEGYIAFDGMDMKVRGAGIKQELRFSSEEERNEQLERLVGFRPYGQ